MQGPSGTPKTAAETQNRPFWVLVQGVTRSAPGCALIRTETPPNIEMGVAFCVNGYGCGFKIVMGGVFNLLNQQRLV